MAMPTDINIAFDPNPIPSGGSTTATVTWIDADNVTHTLVAELAMGADGNFTGSGQLVVQDEPVTVTLTVRQDEGDPTDPGIVIAKVTPTTNPLAPQFIITVPEA